jgi:hypothetical protein
VLCYSPSQLTAVNKEMQALQSDKEILKTNLNQADEKVTLVKFMVDGFYYPHLSGLRNILSLIFVFVWDQYSSIR